MAAYYNEFDPGAAQWLRELIAKGLIADGEVDERSIIDVRPDELAGFTQCHFFAGIGGWSYALRLAGWPDSRPVWTGSPPCQPFSIAGEGLSQDDPRHLAPHFIRLVRSARPAMLFGEQVASADVFGKAAKRTRNGIDGPPQWAWLDDLSDRLEAASYAIGASDFPSAGVGAPHIRQRTFFGAYPHERLEYAAGNGRIERGAEPSERRSVSGCTLGGLGNSQCAGMEGHGGNGDHDHEPRRFDQDAPRPAAPASTNGRLADPDSRKRDGIANGEGGQCDGAKTGRKQGNSQPAAGRDIRGLADMHGLGWVGRGASQAGFKPGAQQRLNGFCNAGGVADTYGRDASAEREQRCGKQRQQPENRGFGGASDGASPVNSFWENADWLHCRDGKWRPVEPGTFPLAHGISGRVGILRGYGNAINPWAAATFIQAFDQSIITMKLEEAA